MVPPQLCSVAFPFRSCTCWCTATLTQSLFPKSWELSEYITCACHSSPITSFPLLSNFKLDLTEKRIFYPSSYEFDENNSQLKDGGPLTASLFSNCSTNSDDLVVIRDSKREKNALQMEESQKVGNSSTPAGKGGRTLCTAGLKALLLWDRSEKGGWKKCRSYFLFDKNRDGSIHSRINIFFS